MRSRSRRRPLLAALALSALLACATDGADSSDEEGDRVEGYFETLADCREVLFETAYFESFLRVVYESIDVELEPPYDETAVLTVSLGPVGYVRDLELKSVSNPLLESTFQLFIEAPPTLPRAPLDVRQCLGMAPFPLIVNLVGEFQCGEQEPVLDYVMRVHQSLYKILYSPTYISSPGRGLVDVDVRIGPQGEIRSRELKGNPDPRAADKLLAAIHQQGVFPPPPEFANCFAEGPLRLSLHVQGE